MFLRLQNQFYTYCSTLPNFERHQFSWFNEQLNTKYNNNPEELVNLIRDLYYIECIEQEDAISQQQSDDSNRSDSVEMDITDSEGNVSEGNASESELNNHTSSEGRYESVAKAASTLKKTVDEFRVNVGVFHILVSFLYAFLCLI